MVILVVVIILIMKILVNDPGSDEDDYDPDETVSLVFVTVDNRFRANLAKAFTWELVGVNFASILMSVVQAVVITLLFRWPAFIVGDWELWWGRCHLPHRD